ncbi:MAG: 16S rRNA (guanine(527)-N(7))-methyltransferase RsmG, partial [Christensenellales bacterium]
MKDMLISAARECGVEISEGMAESMERYWTYLKEVNESMNLTRVESDEEAVSRHFVDSLIPLKFDIIPAGAGMMDLGSGAGFPGMPLAIARPDVHVTLVDSLGKRVNFLKEAANRAGVNIDAVHARAEEAAKGDMREKFDIVTARAVAR